MDQSGFRKAGTRPSTRPSRVLRDPARPWSTGASVARVVPFGLVESPKEVEEMLRHGLVLDRPIERLQLRHDVGMGIPAFGASRTSPRGALHCGNPRTVPAAVEINAVIDCSIPSAFPKT